MTKWPSLILLLLIISIALNLYLLNKINKYSAITHGPQTAHEIAAAINTDKNNSLLIDNRYSSHEITNTPHLASREETLQQAYEWLKEQKFADLTSLLQSYLKQHPQDMDFLLLEAKLKVETSLLSDAIAHYYALLRHPMTAGQQTEIEQTIERLSNSTINQLISTYSWDVLARFIEPLLQIDPENRLYILSLAKAYAQQYQASLMENILASLPFDDPSALTIRQIVSAQKMKQEQQYTADKSLHSPIAELGSTIDLKQYGDQYVVSAKLADNDIDLLIDTGASITAISEQYYNNLSNRYKINLVGRFNVNTANGTVRAPMYKFRELTINHISVENISVLVLPMGNLQHADGLMGMNFLREFDFKIDQKRAVMMIE